MCKGGEDMKTDCGELVYGCVRGAYDIYESENW